MSVWISETVVLEGSKEDVERFCNDVNRVTDSVFKKTHLNKEDFLKKGLLPNFWELYSEEINKVYPTEIMGKGNKYQLMKGGFACNNVLTVSSLNGQLFYTVLKRDSIGMPCNYRELFRKYYPQCRYYYYYVIENGGCETNDINGRYFRIQQRSSLFFRSEDFYGFVTEEEYLKIMQNLMHDTSLKLDDVINSCYHDTETEALLQLHINVNDRAEINSSKGDVPVENLTCPVLDHDKTIAEEIKLKEFMARIQAY